MTRPTSRDVAHAAGVSQATVSLVLAGKWRGRVSERTATHVRETADALGYRPNLAARNLRLGSTRTALLVVPALTNEFFARVYTGAAKVAAGHGFGVVLYLSPDGTGPARDPFASARTALDGIIASSMATDALEGIRGEDQDLPLVMLDSDPTAGGASAYVNIALADGMTAVTTHLLDQGHRHFLHLASAVDSWTFDIRAAALARTLGPGTTLRTVRAPLTITDACAAMERALADHTGPATARPTAVVCDDDILAVGACKAARRLGLALPEDLSVTGFDDMALATAVEPELTTVRIPAERVGEDGMRALLAVLEGHAWTAPPLPVELVVRGSTAPPTAR
ncbi:LacI family DNA-binding transcriptional regulator [Streptomyces sp. NPDC090022]|uniref:LacI family DNA-binding transcriptional regulator n=1 Tax=Streptomyces sp. NPDC090022 TaxID=3365920 RepID=UPI00382227DF